MSCKCHVPDGVMASQCSACLASKAPDLFVAFSARRLSAPSVAWLNLRYWAHQGWAVNTQADIERLQMYVLDSCAWAIPQPDDPASAFTDDECELLADRYGAPNGSSHGGSARAGAKGHFLLKGIGRNPLAGDGGDRYHSDGHLWLHEAVKDAVYSELTWLECPSKAVSTAAIIDTGLISEMPDGGRFARRAILVRPFPMRFAHLERSLYFGKGGGPLTAQYADARRVEQIEGIVFGGLSACDSLLHLAQLLKPVARQAGFCRFWKLSHDFTSSNTGLGGQLLDFGGFYCLPDWRRLRRDAWLLINQIDISDFCASILHICHRILNKSTENLDARPENITQLFAMAVHQAFLDEIRIIVDVGASASFQSELSAAVSQLFHVSQQGHIDFSRLDRSDPEQLQVMDMLAGNLVSSESPIGNAIANIRSICLEPRDDIDDRRAKAALDRVLFAVEPRGALMLEQAEIDIAAITDPRANDTARMQADRIRAYILATIADCRRPSAAVGTPRVHVAYATDLVTELFFEYDAVAGEMYLTSRDHRDNQPRDLSCTVDCKHFQGEALDKHYRVGGISDIDHICSSMLMRDFACSFNSRHSKYGDCL